MASSSFGELFTITTWGESHGKAIGVVIDGCPSNLEISEEEINRALAKRAPGNLPFTSKRKEPDLCQILSGVFEGKTTGAPISILIHNKDVDSAPYKKIEHLLRPGHASYTYLKKYQHVDPRGGGRASARETACRVAAGAIAKKWLSQQGIEVKAYLHSIADITVRENRSKWLKESAIFCPDLFQEKKMLALLEEVEKEGDSLGGFVFFLAEGLPVGLGEPIYDKLEAKLAYAMLSIPASKGFEIGEGFSSSFMRGSQHNDEYCLKEDRVSLTTNHSGGTLGGISTGEALWGKVAFKPTSSIKKEQKSVDIVQKKESSFLIPKTGRHDPCVAIRAVPVVEAMLALVIMDIYLIYKARKWK